MTDTTAPRFTSKDYEDAAWYFKQDDREANQRFSAMLDQAAADLAAAPTENELKVAVREYAAGVRDYDGPEDTPAYKARAADIASILSAHTPYIINALIAAGVRVRG